MKLHALALIFVSLLPACAGEPTPPAASPPVGPPVFTFARTEGQTYKQTLSRHDEVAIVGAPLRQSEDWRMHWDMRVSRESNLIKLHAELTALELSINGAQLLKGSEITPAKAFIELLFDRDGKLVDVRRADTLTAAIVSLVPATEQEATAKFFAPEVLRWHFAQLAHERSADLLGHSAEVGASWQGQASAEEAAVAPRKLTVEATQPCGASTCVRVTRETTIDKQLVWAAARSRVDAFVKSKGGDPSKVSLVDAKITLEDEFVVNPANLEFHSVTFHQRAELSVATAEGPLTVAFTTDRDAELQY